MTEYRPLLGVLGGLGPMSTVRFYELLTQHTYAESDADHIDLLISSRASTPDRTAYILGKSDADPLPVMIEEAERLVRAGANLLVIPCNTAHYFYDGLRNSCRVPILNIIDETVQQLKREGVHRFGLLATEGTVRSSAYAKICEPMGIKCLTPDKDKQEVISSLIYHGVKCGKAIDPSALNNVIASLLSRGCERIVLGCTELSLLRSIIDPTFPILDSLEVLAYRTILSCRKQPIGFASSFEIDREEARL